MFGLIPNSADRVPGACPGRGLKGSESPFSKDPPFYRLARILVRLPALRLMSSNITEELFFTGLIGNVSIDSIIPYILKMETAEYNGQITGASL